MTKICRKWNSMVSQSHHFKFGFSYSTHLCIKDIAKGYAKLVVQVNTVIAAIVQNLKQNNAPFMESHTIKYTVIQDNAEFRNLLIQNFKNQRLMNTLFLLLQFLFLIANVQPPKITSNNIFLGWSFWNIFQPTFTAWCLLLSALTLQVYWESLSTSCFQNLTRKMIPCDKAVQRNTLELLMNFYFSSKEKSFTNLLKEKFNRTIFFCVIHDYCHWLF